MAEQVSGDDKSQDGHKHRDEQLPRPEVTLKEETDKRNHAANDATDNLRSEMEDQSRHQTAETNEQPLKCAVEHIEHAGKAHRDTSEATQETHEDPHLENDVLIDCPTMGTLIVLIKEVHHQRRSHQRNAEPYPEAPELVPKDQREKFHKEEEGRGIPPGEKEVLASRFDIAIHISADFTDNIQFVCCSHI